MIARLSDYIDAGNVTVGFAFAVMLGLVATGILIGVGMGVWLAKPIYYTRGYRKAFSLLRTTRIPRL